MRFHLLFMLGAALVQAGGSPGEFLFEPLASHPKCHAVTVAERPDGTLVAAWFAGEREGTPDQAIFIAEKKRGAKAWSKPRIAVDIPNIPDFNPVLMSVGPRLRLLFVQQPGPETKRTTLWRCDEKAGGSWSKPEPVDVPDGFWGRNAVIRAGGRWVMPVSDVAERGSRVLLSPDGISWRPSALVRHEKYLTQPAVAEGPGGALVAVFRERDKKAGHIWLARSKDGGETWTAPKPLDLPNNDSGIALQALPGGRLLLVYNHSQTARTPLNTAVSADGGETWKPGQVLEDAPGEYSYPTALRDRQGRVHVFYTWKRTHIRHQVIEP